MSAGSLVLKFKTLPQKQQFDIQLRSAVRTRDAQTENHRQFERDILYQADRPQRDQERVSGRANVGSFNDPSGIFVPNGKKKAAEGSSDDWAALQAEIWSSPAKPKKKSRLRKRW